MHLFDHIVVIDPGTRVAETDSFNHIARWSSLPCTYHLPILSGSDTFEEESLDHVKAIVILGGSGNMYDDLAWRNELETWFKKAMDQKIPTLGICWGHQWIAHLFGGEIGDAHDGGEKMRGFRKIYVQEAGPYKESTNNVVISHRSMVKKAPSSAECFVTSDLLNNEGFAYKDYPIYSFQSHPEATKAFLKNNSIPHQGDEDLDCGNGLVKTFLNWSIGPK